MIVILVPILVAYELAAASPYFRRDFPIFRRALGGLGLSPSAGPPLLAGFFLGIAYGAGIIIPATRERNLGRRDVLGISLFLCTCHAVVEDTLLFVLVGANAAWLVGIRFTLAVVAVRIGLRIAAPQPAPNPTA